MTYEPTAFAEVLVMFAVVVCFLPGTVCFSWRQTSARILVMARKVALALKPILLLVCVEVCFCWDCFVYHSFEVYLDEFAALAAVTRRLSARV